MSSLEQMFKDRVGYSPDFKRPRTFNEKVGWRKLYQHEKEHVVMSDKLASKVMVRGLSPELNVHEVLWQGEEPKFMVLRAPCVVKVRAGSGSNVVIKGPVTYQERVRAVRLMEGALKKVYGKEKGEWAYSQVPKGVFVEEYEKRPFQDVKFFTFGGKVKMICYMKYGNGHRLVNCSYFRPDGTFVDVVNSGYPVVVKELPLSEEVLATGVRRAEECSAGCDFVRVDLYYIKEADEWIFGEYTLYPTSGMGRYEPKSFDEELGSYWRIP